MTDALSQSDDDSESTALSISQIEQAVKKANQSLVAASFQGFQKQMAEVEEQAGNDSPLTRLCADTLATIGAPPGRIYERHRLTVTPTDEIKDVAKTLAGKTLSGGDASKPEGK